MCDATIIKTGTVTQNQEPAPKAVTTATPEQRELAAKIFGPTPEPPQARTPPRVTEAVKDTAKLNGPELPNEGDLERALFAGALFRGATHELPSGHYNKSSKCSTCLQSQPHQQSWKDHNLSVHHINALIRNRGFNSTFNQLEKNTVTY